MISIKQAAERVGKSELTIRRLIKATLTDNPKTPAKIITQRKGAYMVDEAWLDAQYGVVSVDVVTKTDSTFSEPRSDDVLAAKDQTISLLMKELDMLTGQLAAKDDQIAAMNERARESNVLMARLQERLALDGPQPPRPADVGRTADDVQDASEVQSPKKRRGLFRRK